MRRLNLIISGVLFICSLASASQFDDWAKAFDKGSLPDLTKLTGHWSGRCLDAVAPDAHQPAVYFYGSRAGVPAITQSYYTERSAELALFDKMTAQQVEDYQPIKEHFAREQWNPVHVEGETLLNDFAVSKDSSIRRSLKAVKEEFKETLILRITRLDAAKLEHYRYCTFTQRLADNQPAPEGSIAIGQVGVTANQWVRITNFQPEIVFSALQLRNEKGTFDMQSSSMVMVDGSMAYGPTSATFQPYQNSYLRMGHHPYFRFRSLDFYVRGLTTGMEIRGIPAGSGKGSSHEPMILFRSEK